MGSAVNPACVDLAQVRAQFRLGQHLKHVVLAARQNGGGTFVGLGAGQNEAHTVDEWIDLNEFRGACQLALHLATMD